MERLALLLPNVAMEISLPTFKSMHGFPIATDKVDEGSDRRASRLFMTPLTDAARSSNDHCNSEQLLS